MKWFKFATNTSEDPFTVSLEAEFGLIGFARWVKLLEVIALHSDNESGFKLVYPAFKWQTILKAKRKQLETFLVHLEKQHRIKLEANGDIIGISIPNMLELRDNYSRNLQVSCKPRACREDLDLDKNPPPYPPPVGEEEDFTKSKNQTPTAKAEEEDFSKSSNPETHPLPAEPQAKREPLQVLGIRISATGATDRPPPPDPSPPGGHGRREFVWHQSLHPLQRDAMAALLARVPDEEAQLLLDEVSGSVEAGEQNGMRPIDNPPALLKKYLRDRDAGEWAPGRAIAVQARRKAAEANAKAKAAAEKKRDKEVPQTWEDLEADMLASIEALQKNNPAMAASARRQLDKMRARRIGQ